MFKKIIFYIFGFILTCPSLLISSEQNSQITRLAGLRREREYDEKLAEKTNVHNLAAQEIVDDFFGKLHKINRKIDDINIAATLEIMSNLQSHSFATHVTVNRKTYSQFILKGQPPKWLELETHRIISNKSKK